MNEMEEIEYLEDLESRKIELQPTSFIDIVSAILRHDVEGFEKEAGLGFLDGNELDCVRHIFINHFNAQTFENTYGISLSNSKLLLLNAAYTILVTSTSYKGKKLDTIFSRIYKLFKSPEKEKRSLFKRGDEELM